MPRPPRPYRRRRFLKKKAVRRARVRKANNQKVDARFDYKVQGTLSIGTGTLVSTYVLALVSPLGGQASGLGYPNLYSNPEFVLQRYNFDEVKVTGFTVKFKPVVSMVGIYDQNSMGQQTQTDSILHTWVDRDSNTLTASSQNVVAKVKMYDSYKGFNCFKPWSRKVRVEGLWMDTSSGVFGQTSSGIGTALQASKGMLTTLGIYGQNLPFPAVAQSESYGQVEIIWHVCFRGKRPASLSLDPITGALTVLPEENFAPLQPTAIDFPQANDVGTLKSKDLSGNVIYITP